LGPTKRMLGHHSRLLRSRLEPCAFCKMLIHLFASFQRATFLCFSFFPLSSGTGRDGGTVPILIWGCGSQAHVTARRLARATSQFRSEPPSQSHMSQEIFTRVLSHSRCANETANCAVRASDAGHESRDRAWVFPLPPCILAAFWAHPEGFPRGSGRLRRRRAVSRRTLLSFEIPAGPGAGVRPFSQSPVPRCSPVVDLGSLWPAHTRPSDPTFHQSSVV
jgi:hypothetical protein